MRWKTGLVLVLLILGACATTIISTPIGKNLVLSVVNAFTNCNGVDLIEPHNGGGDDVPGGPGWGG